MELVFVLAGVVALVFREKAEEDAQPLRDQLEDANERLAAALRLASTESRDRRPGRLRNGSGTGLAASLTSAAMFPLTPCP
jgi:hypothetical protein